MTGLSVRLFEVGREFSIADVFRSKTKAQKVICNEQSSGTRGAILAFSILENIYFSLALKIIYQVRLIRAVRAPSDYHPLTNLSF